MKKIKSILFKAIGVICILFVCIFCLALCDASNDEVTEPTAEQVTEIKAPDEAEIISIVENIAQLSYGNDYEYTVYVEDKTVHLDVWDIGLGDNLTTLIMYNTLEPWEALVDSSSAASLSMYQMIEDIAPEYSCVHTIYDKIDGEDCVFISSMNGTILFDMVEEITN